jgi:hypothetical protein
MDFLLAMRALLVGVGSFGLLTPSR